MVALKLLTAYGSDEPVITSSEFARQIIRSAGLRIRVAVPATVVAYTAAEAERPPSVDVNPAFQIATVDDQGVESLTDMPKLQRVPIAFYAVGGFKITSTPKVGEEGLVVFLDRSGSGWLAEGGIVDPLWSHTHSLSDGIFFPGLRSAGKAFPVTEGKFVIGLEDETTKFEIDEITGALVLDSKDEVTILAAANMTLTASGATLELDAATEVKIGALAAEFAVKHASLSSQLATWVTILNTHVHATAAIGPPVPMAVPLVALTGAEAATKAKVE